MSSYTKFKHNKKRNSGLVYEFLMRKISESLIDCDRTSYDSSMKIIKRYFSPGTPIDEERQLFEGIMSVKGVSEPVARGVIVEIRKEAKKLDHKIIDIKKSNVIKEIHKEFGAELFSKYKLDDYKVYASIQLLINSCNPSSSINENIQRIQLEESLVSFMTLKHKDDIASGETIDDLVYSMAVNNFNSRYVDLSEGQKRFLSEYTSLLSCDDPIPLSSFMKENKNAVLKIIRESFDMKELINDDNMRSKMKNVENALLTMNMDMPTKATVEEMMLYIKLVEEVASND